MTPGRVILLGITTVMLILLVSCTVVVKESELFHPRALPVAPQSLSRLDFALTATSGDTLRGYYLTGKDYQRTAWYFYGNGETAEDVHGRLYMLCHTLQCNIVVVDYRGYGYSNGVPTFAGIYNDLPRIYDHIRKHIIPTSQPFFAMGYSIGTVFAIKLATQCPVAGVVLFAPTSSAPASVKAFERQLPWYARWFINMKAADNISQPALQPIAQIAKVTAPILVFHGTKDDMIPYELGKALFDAAPMKDKQFITLRDKTHYFSQSKPPVVDSVRVFLDRLTANMQ